MVCGVIRLPLIINLQRHYSYYSGEPADRNANLLMNIGPQPDGEELPASSYYSLGRDGRVEHVA